MKFAQARMRMFAGPNGSGKTTIKNGLQRPPQWFGIYVNPDDIEKTIRETGALPLEPYGVTTDTNEVRDYFASSKFLQSKQVNSPAAGISVHSDVIHVAGPTFSSYDASVLADFLRRKALRASKTFSFETVMSSRDKVDLLSEAKAQGFRTYLYYVATEDPSINVERVKNRVHDGGHNVPEDKVISRYYRSLALLPESIRHTDRAFLFDTSEEISWWFAEVSGGTNVQLKSSAMPNWFKPIWDQF